LKDILAPDWFRSRFTLYLHLSAVTVALLLALFLPVSSGAQESEGIDIIEFIYINANVGGAAGGHTALKLGEDVFHYQFFPDKRFLLVRESWDQFKLVYTRLRNRSIYTALCRVDSSSYQKIKDNFTRVLGAQAFDLYREDLLEEQLLLLHGFGAESLSIRVAGLGFFDPSATDSADAVMLRTLVRDRLGEGFLAEQQLLSRNRLDALITLVVEQGAGSEKLYDLLIELGDTRKKLAALEVLEKGLGLLDSALSADPPDLVLTEEQVQALRTYLDRQLQSTLELLASERPDMGEALLLQLARCQALLLSLKSDRLLTLDPYPDDAPIKAVDPADHEMQLYMIQLRDIYLKNRAVLLDLFAQSSGFSADLLYNMLENVNGRLAEVSGGIDSAHPVRASYRLMSPSRGAVSEEPLAVAGEIDFSPLEKELASRQDSFSESLADKYYYRLITRNCVNELLKTINSSFSDPAEVENGLGASIDPEAEMVVMPHDLYSRVVRNYRVLELRYFPSRRSQGLEILSESMSQPRLWLQEGNTLSSTLYTPRTEDTPFLFFTDDQSWARPLLGVGNLGWAAVYSLGGIFSLATGNVEPFYQGLRGMFYSLPELFFANIRKGTYLQETFSGTENNL
jgi:hypothetical protein